MQHTGRLTGHIAVPSNWKCDEQEIKNENYWKVLIAKGEAQFYNSAFHVQRSICDRIIKTESIYKWEIPELKIENPSVIDIYDSGFVLIFFNNGLFKARQTSSYKILAKESETYNTSKQRRIIYEYSSALNFNEVLLFGLGFNPNILR